MLAAAELACERGGRSLFRALSLELAPGDLVRIAGPNGCGKTSLLRILCGLLAPTAGEVRWNGEPIGELREEYAKGLVYIGHAPAVKDELTAVENLGITLKIAGGEASEVGIRGALERLGLAQADVPVKKLSQGQRRRAALARLVLSRHAPLWLLDEPLAALDPEAARAVEALVAEHVAAGGIAVYTTHQAASLDAAVKKVVDLGAAR